MFSNGVASGQPTQNGFCLWTRVDSNLSIIDMTLLIADNQQFDNAMSIIINHNKIKEENDNCVTVPITGLQAGTTYYYKFIYDGNESRIGKAKTLPTNFPIKIGLFTCQHFSTGVYGVFDYAATQDFDFCILNGDIIYENKEEIELPGREISLPSGGTYALDLADYRYLYARYRSDESFQNFLANQTIIVRFDDHEIANDWYFDANINSINSPTHPYGDDPVLMTQLKADAMKAFSEWLPIQQITAYYYFDISQYMRVFMLDERDWRKPHACGLAYKQRVYVPPCPQSYSTSQTLLGFPQRGWLVNSIQNSPCQYNIIVSPTLLSRFFVPGPVGEGPRIAKTDSGTGYMGETAFIATNIGNKKIVILSGDLHASSIGYFLRYPDLEKTGIEIMTPAASSKTIGEELWDKIGLSEETEEAIIKAVNPQTFEMFNSYKNGFVGITFNADNIVVIFNYIDRLTGQFTSNKTFIIDSGYNIIPGNP